jgi:hypothetical protein
LCPETESLHHEAGETLRRYGARNYFLVNILFLVFVLIADAFDVRSAHDPLPYLVLLFTLCTYPLFMVREPNGRFCLLVVASPLMFLFFGFNDLLSYFLELKGRYISPAGTVFTFAEMVILSGLSSLFLGYAVAAALFERSKLVFFREGWNTGRTVIVGLILLILGSYATYKVQTSIDVNLNFNVESKGSEAFLILGRMLEPVGAVLLSYGYMKTRSFQLLLLILVIAFVKLPIGMILNSKEIGVSFAATFLATKWIYDGKIPLRWLLLFLTVLIFYFPLSYAYRGALGATQLTVGKSMDNLDKFFEKSMKGGKKNEQGFAFGIDSFAARNDYKTIVEIIVNKTGMTVPFQEGHTLAELPYVFVPRMMMPNKPVASVGQLFNRAFKLSANRNTYISTSFIGEMYWNFGLFGSLAGMFCIGLLWGGIGGATNVREQISAPKVLLMMIAIYTMVLKFETGIAQEIILFLRSGMIIFILHFILKKRRVKEAFDLDTLGSMSTNR